MTTPSSELKRPFWKKRWLLVVLLAAVALVILSGGLGGIVYFQPRVATQGLAKLNPDVLFEVPTTKKIVALTIDDGPHGEITPQVLDLLAEFGVRATFFVLGGNIAGNEALMQRMRDGGHEVGNHLVKDRPSITLSEEEFIAELKEVDPWVDPEAPLRWLRPGSGWFTPEMVDLVQRHGYGLCLGSIFPHDDKIHDPEKLSRWVLDRVYPGAIIILHDGLDERASLPVTLDRVLTGLKERGYEVTTVSDLVREGN